MAQLGKGQLTAPDWVCCLFEPRAKLQGSWGHKLKSLNREVYLDLLSQDDKVDFRSFGGPGAGAFLEAPVVREDETPTFVPNAHFIVALRDRLMLPVCPPGSTCHRRNKDGVICGKPLDPRGKHCKQCKIGPARIGRHDSLCDFSAGYHRRTTGLAVSTEQRVACDRVNPRTGDLEEARLDYAT